MDIVKFSLKTGLKCEIAGLLFAWCNYLSVFRIQVSKVVLEKL